MTASPASDSPADVERVRLLYRETNVPAEVLASCLGLARTTFYRRVDKWDWPRRRAGRSSDAPPGNGALRRHAEERLQAASRSTRDRCASFETPASRAPQNDAEGSSLSGSRHNAHGSSLPGFAPATPRETTAQAMERFIAERLAALQAEAAGRDADPERTARTVAQYARALQVMQATRAHSDKETTPDEAEPPARSLSELRDELRGHLERIWDETRARRRVRPAEPDAG